MAHKIILILVFSIISAAMPAYALGPKVPDPIPTVIPKGDVSVRLTSIAKGFVAPITATYAPNDKNRLYVAELNGKIWSLSLNGKGKARTLFADIGARGLNLGCFGSNYDERGLLGIAFHPAYRSNGLVYTYQSLPHLNTATPPANQCNRTSPDHDNVVTEWKVNNPRGKNPKVNPASAREVLRVDHPQFNHNGGELRFGADGMLYVSIGDGGSADDQGNGHTVPGGNAQDLTNLSGKILRIDPQPGSTLPGYKIPADNPFANTVGVRGEIWAYGLRNPYKMSFDTATNRLYVADVGQNDVEEINIVSRGLNYGWPVKEGSFAFDQNGTDAGFVTADIVTGAYVDPIAQHDHCIPPVNTTGQCQASEGSAVVGGFVYRGNTIKKLRGLYVFGNYGAEPSTSSGRLLYLDAQKQVKEFQLAGKRSLGLGLSVLGFGQDARGEVYLLGKSGASQGNIGITDPNNRSGVVLKLAPSKAKRSKSGGGTANPTPAPGY